jgi:hypothetical protein
MGESEEALAAAIETLESLQRSYARSDEDLEAASKRRNEFTEDFAGKLGLSQDFLSFADAQRRDAASRMFSRYENPNWFLIVSLIVRDIEAVISQMGKLKDGKKIIFGTSPTGEINGLAADVNNPEYYIVLIEDGVFGYSNLLAKGIAHMFPIAEGESGGQTYSTDLAEVEKNIKKSPMLIMRLVDLVFAYIVEGHPHAAEPYLPDKRYADLASTWCQAILTFVLAHEFGHAWLGHLEEPGENTAVAEESSIPLPSWERELQADHFALAVTLLVLDKQGRPPRLT